MADGVFGMSCKQKKRTGGKGGGEFGLELMADGVFGMSCKQKKLTGGKRGLRLG